MVVGGDEESRSTTSEKSCRKVHYCQGNQYQCSRIIHIDRSRRAARMHRFPKEEAESEEEEEEEESESKKRKPSVRRASTKKAADAWFHS